MLVKIEKRDIPRLVDIIVKILKLKCIVNLDAAGRKYYKEDSIWGEICIEYLGYFDTVISLNIFTKYIRNYFTLKQLVDRRIGGGSVSSINQICATVENNCDSNVSNSGIEINRIVNNNTSDNNENSLTVLIVPSEFRELLNWISSADIRRTFKAGFSHFLTKKLQTLHVNCYLRSVYNWFGVSGSWHGVYKCISCGKKFVADISQVVKIFKNAECVYIDIKWLGEILHEKIMKPSKYSGSNRRQCALEVMSKGASRFRSKMIVDNRGTLG